MSTTTKPKASDLIREIRAIKGHPLPPGYPELNGEQIPGIYQAHMAALETERHLDHARRLVDELFGLMEHSGEGPCPTPERCDEIEGLLLLWGVR